MLGGDHISHGVGRSEKWHQQSRSEIPSIMCNTALNPTGTRANGFKEDFGTHADITCSRFHPALSVLQLARPSVAHANKKQAATGLSFQLAVKYTCQHVQLV